MAPLNSAVNRQPSAVAHRQCLCAKRRPREASTPCLRCYVWEEEARLQSRAGDSDSLLPNEPKVKKIVLDFEKAMWRPIWQVMPNVELMGCSTRRKPYGGRLV